VADDPARELDVLVKYGKIDASSRAMTNRAIARD
jgi:hypothetical protein